jgi:serine/threonine-protein kinase
MVRKYPWSKAMPIGLQMASGLTFAHKNNIVHGNLRPSNVLFDADDDVKLTDFGLPVHYDAAGKKNWYNPPEHKPSRQGDIYAVGVILHQMITGRNPTYDTAGSLRLDDVASVVPDEISAILSKLLAVRVAHRYKSMDEMLLDYDDFDQRRQVAERRQQLPIEQPVERKRSLPGWALAAAGAGLILTVLVVLYFSGALG